MTIDDEQFRTILRQKLRAVSEFLYPELWRCSCCGGTRLEVKPSVLGVMNGIQTHDLRCQACGHTEAAEFVFGQDATLHTAWVPMPERLP